jgi:hypothetical protein
MGVLRTALIVAIGLLLCGCADFNRNRALLLNKKIAVINDSLAAKTNRWENVMAEDVVNGEYSNLKDLRHDIETYISSKTAQLQHSRNGIGADDYCTAEKELLEYQSKIMRDDYAMFEMFDLYTDMNTVSLAIEKLNYDNLIKKSKLTKLNNIRETFLSRNKIAVTDSVK